MAVCSVAYSAISQFEKKLIGNSKLNIEDLCLLFGQKKKNLK